MNYLSTNIIYKIHAFLNYDSRINFNCVLPPYLRWCNTFNQDHCIGHDLKYRCQILSHLFEKINKLTSPTRHKFIVKLLKLLSIESYINISRNSLLFRQQLLTKMQEIVSIISESNINVSKHYKIKIKKLANQVYSNTFNLITEPINSLSHIKTKNIQTYNYFV